MSRVSLGRGCIYMKCRQKKFQVIYNLPFILQAIKADPKAKERVLTSYRMMLDFYGMELADVRKGKLKRTSNWEDRYENLNWYEIAFSIIFTYFKVTLEKIM